MKAVWLLPGVLCGVSRKRVLRLESGRISPCKELVEEERWGREEGREGADSRCLLSLVCAGSTRS